MSEQPEAIAVPEMGRVGELEADVCVVGAGPAGLALALMLLRSGVKVALLERSTGLRRDFHGEILQPGGQRILGDLGVLDAARERGACTLKGFQVLQDQRLVLDIDYRRLQSPYDCLLALPQRHLLQELLAACRGLPGFTLLEGYRLNALLRDGDAVTGAVAQRGTGHTATVRARVVVGADGRFSRTRMLAGIDAGRTEAFDQDVVWFALPAPGLAPGYVQVHRTERGALLVHDTHPGRLRIGWTLPHRSWNRVAALGIDAIRRELTDALPQFAELFREHPPALSDLQLLDVFAAQAQEWVRDGLMLVGDSAHTHGPIGAQGINLALQDAAAAHPVLLDAVRAGDASRDRLLPYEQRRRPAAASVHRMQRIQAKAVLGHGGPVVTRLRSRAAAVVTRSRIGERITRKVAYGIDPVDVRTDLFEVTPAAPEAPAPARRA
ncbi:FAD-dependent monooxygenase [Streptomyces sp. S.PB5]|uniref:FAD-dependent monooxygenase n=1 Tax=Streptomyces sp. S.PB5 TaxID=3020844 RepID=UPI0025B1F497|nr:FAD-dependent monooxygenase [Streptomyces sp. S.PB5]MDN3027276.1 FAD-dependent monooxygenase [Streptomyces sp. S.PB5]